MAAYEIVEPNFSSTASLSAAPRSSTGVPTRIEPRNRTCRPREIHTDAHRAEPTPPTLEATGTRTLTAAALEFTLPSVRFHTHAPRLAPIVGPPCCCVARR